MRVFQISVRCHSSEILLAVFNIPVTSVSPDLNTALLCILLPTDLFELSSPTLRT